MNAHIEDFTQGSYERIILLVKQKYKFITYQSLQESQENVVLWRHDVDFSMHRALKLAIIEAENSVVSTYFFHLHSNMYNLLEKEIFEIGRKILKLGHEVGLHFEPSFYDLDIRETERFNKCLELEKQLLEELFDTKIRTFSFHNPDIGGWVKFEDFSACGMINTYSKFLKDNFTYCSDSNGYWRFKRLEDVVNGNEKKLHILLHPEWWVPSEMTPRDRVNRCIDGRKEKCNYLYDKCLEEMGRLNVN